VLAWLSDLHMSQLMPLPLTVFCFSKIQIGFTFLVPADPGSPGKKAVKWVCVLYGCRAGEPLSPGAIATFSVDHKSGRELRQYLSSVADQCEHGSAELPCVIILDSLHHVTSLSEVFNGFLSVHYQTRSCPIRSCLYCFVPFQRENSIHYSILPPCFYRLYSPLTHSVIHR